MKTHAMHLRQVARHESAAPLALRLLHAVTSRYLALPIGAAAALIWANTLPESYFTFALALAFPVNAIAMVFFFGLLAQELYEEMMPGGALHHRRRWPVPLIAGAGGVVGAALTFLFWTTWKTTPLLAESWGVVAGVDIVFAYFTVRAIFRRHPAVAFLLLMAVGSNAIGFIVLAPNFVFDGVRAGGSGLVMAGAIGLAACLRRRHVRQFWPYVLICGSLSWLALYLEGFPPAMALVPIVPFMPHTRRQIGDLLEDEADARGATPRHYEHVWHYHVQVALLLFGLVNAGVMIGGYGDGSEATFLASIAGRSIGILAATALAVAIGLHLPAHLGWRELLVVALAASAGFTFVLFFAVAILPAGPVLAELKLGALGTVVALPLAIGLARALRVGRFHQ